MKALIQMGYITDFDNVLQENDETAINDFLSRDDIDLNKLLHLFINSTLAVKKLLEKGANPNCCSRNISPLIRAIIKNNGEVIKLLLDHDADPNLASGRHLPLMIAVQEENILTVRLLLSKGANPNLGDRFNDFPLYIASLNRNFEMMEALLLNGANPNFNCGFSQSTLLLYSLQDDIKFTELLLNHGADPNQPNSFNETPLCFAVQKGNLEAVRLLLKWNADPSLGGGGLLKETPLYLALSENYLNIFLELLNHNADPQQPGGELCKLYDVKLLHNAAQNGNLIAIDLLLERGVDPNPCSKIDETPLIFAVQEGHLPIVQRLLTFGKVRDDVHHIKEALLIAQTNAIADPIKYQPIIDCIAKNITPSSLTQLLYLALIDENFEFAKELLSQGANPNLSCGVEVTPLLYCLTQNLDIKFVELLLTFGANANQSSSPLTKITPLCSAVHQGDLESTILLLRSKADPNLGGPLKATPLYTALRKNYLKIALELLNHGADPNQAGCESHELMNITLLDDTAENGNLAALNLLLEMGADSNPCNKMDKTPLVTAAEKGHLPIVERLLTIEKVREDCFHLQKALELAQGSASKNYEKYQPIIDSLAYHLAPFALVALFESVKFVPAAQALIPFFSSNKRKSTDEKDENRESKRQRFNSQ